jgi:flagellar biosynthesis protein FlhF
MASMNLKTYRAPTMAEALVEVKKDLGKDAVILHARTYKVGGVLGVGGRQMVEITASDSTDVAGPRLKPRDPAPASDFTPARFDSIHAPSPRPIAPPAPRAPEPQVRAPRPAAPAPLPQPSPQTYSPLPPAPAARPRLPHTPVPVAPATSAATEDLKAEIASIKSLVGQLLQASRPAGPSGNAQSGLLSLGGLPEPLMELYMLLQKGGMAPEFAERCIAKIREDASAADLHSAPALRDAALRVLSGMLPVVGGIPKLTTQPDGRPLTIAFVGPTGVGKTTTIAKLAATYKLRMNRRVAMITADTYRIAAVDQLRTYANIIGLPVKVAMTPQDLASAAESFAGFDVILIDTAGRSQHDASRLDELRQFIAAGAPHETHLVVSAAMAEAVTLSTIERFKPASPDRMIVTKLDEAVGFGSLVSIAHAAGLPISHITTGQEVPDDFEIADARRLATLVLEGVLSR